MKSLWKLTKLVVVACAIWVVIGFLVVSGRKPSAEKAVADEAEKQALACEWARGKLDDVRELTLRGRKHEAEQELASIKRTAPWCFK